MHIRKIHWWSKESEIKWLQFLTSGESPQMVWATKMEKWTFRLTMSNKENLNVSYPHIWCLLCQATASISSNESLEGAFKLFSFMKLSKFPKTLVIVKTRKIWRSPLLIWMCIIDTVWLWKRRTLSFQTFKSKNFLRRLFFVFHWI